MILELDEKAYRAYPALNQSALKTYNGNPKIFHQKYILKQEVPGKEEEQLKEAMIYGQICDCLLTCEEEFDSRFVISMDEVTLKPQMKKFCESLWKYTILYTVDDVLTETFDFICEVAYKDVGIKGTSLEKLLENFKEEGIEYYTCLRDRGNRTFITQKDYEKACLLIDRLKNHPFSKEIINMKSEGEWEVKKQMMVVNDVNGISMKGMLDYVMINHNRKIVLPVDLKVGSNAEMFMYNYTKLGYYIQMAAYTCLLRAEYPEYDVKPLSFLAVDRTMFMDPIKYISTEETFNEGMNGFIKDGRKYKGLNEIMKNYKYSLENDYWTGPIEAHKNNGRILLN